MDVFLMKFLRGSADALVIEDADHFLQPRSEGNRELHRILVIADGVARSRGRKIIFSTNLRNIGDLDEALLRPGRCYARLNLPNLTSQQVEALLRDLLSHDVDARGTVARVLAASGKDCSLAEVFKAVTNHEASGRVTELST
jgi:ATP-dependent 26S proteasome regulatory subunit